ncbi:MAG: hypothetical protein ACYDGT_09270 [Thermoleophilia bacterium]
MNWEQFVVAPVLAAAVGFTVWYIQSRIERIRREEERILDERRTVYLTILDPFIRIFAGINKPAEAKKAQEQLVSYEYKRTALEFNLIGSDNVVHSFNTFMQYNFKSESDPKVMLTLWGELLLEIRRSVGDPKTDLEPVDMLKAQINDIDTFLDKDAE